MLIIIILITVSLAIALTFLGLFLWNVRSGQYDDIYTPSVRMLFEDKVVRMPEPGSDADEAAPQVK